MKSSLGLNATPLAKNSSSSSTSLTFFARLYLNRLNEREEKTKKTVRQKRQQKNRLCILKKTVNSPARRIGERGEDQVFNGKVRRGVSPVNITLLVHSYGIECLCRTSYALSGQFLRGWYQLLFLVGRQIDLPQTVVAIDSNEVVALRVKGQSQWTATARLLKVFGYKETTVSFSRQ